MISFREQLPLLRVGREELVHYEESWLSDVIQDAARRSGRGDDCWFADEIAKGVLIYLRERFRHSSISIEELFSQIGRALNAMGCEDIADHLEPAAPPMHVSLARLASDAGEGYELIFFQLLKGKLSNLQEIQASKLHCSDLEPCVEKLCRAQKWTRKCDRMRDEILEWLTGEFYANPKNAHNAALVIT